MRRAARAVQREAEALLRQFCFTRFLNMKRIGLVEHTLGLLREDIADYYTESVGGLEPKISERPNYLAMRDALAGLRTEMVLEDGKQPTPELMADIRKQAAKLVELALQRQQ